MLDLEEILDELEKKTEVKREELMKRIEGKQEELSGLVSMEGAAHLVARDLGVDLLKLKERTFKINNITAGMRSINIKARIIDVTPIREFEKKDGTKGKVCNLILSDGTAETRIPLWDKQADMVNDIIKIGDVIEIKNAIARDNVFGGVELILMKSSTIAKVDDDNTIPKSKPEGKIVTRIPIKDMKEGYFEIRGNLIDVFNINPVFQTCPKCKNKVEGNKDSFTCQEHGKVNPESNMIITGIIDDGTGSLRSVFFRDRAKEISDLDPKMLAEMPQEEAINLIKERVLGNEFILQGRIQQNKMFNTPEIIVDKIKELDIEEESKRLIDEIKSLK
jgi:replication factor A1